MKRFLLAFAFVLFCLPVFGEDIDIQLKQGALIRWDTQELTHLTTLTVVKTRPVESWGKMNVLWEGWTLDVGYAYDTKFSSAALLIGREFGTIGKYLPFDFPCKDKIMVTLYPVGALINDLNDRPEVEGCSGLGIVKFEVKW